MDLSQFSDITDPSDFSHENFRKLDSTLRCTICKEFFEAPVLLTQCGHTFCSLCIRNQLPTKPECPLCRKPTKETHLVRNVAFAEAIEAWSRTRKTVLDLIKDSARPYVDTSKKRKLRDGVEERSDARVDPDSPSTSRRKLDDEEVIAIASSPVAEEVVEVVESKPKRQKGEVVPCPLCSQQVLMSSINAHMDSQCKRFLAEEEKVDRTKSKAAWKSIFKQDKRKVINGSSGSQAQDPDLPTTRLAKVSYGTLTLASLKKLLSDFGLQTNGDKDALIIRHERWLAIYNANLDLAHPKPVSELKFKLNELEEAASRPGAKKISDDKDWARKNQDQFKFLISQAKVGSKVRKTESANYEKTDTLSSEAGNG